MLGLGEKAEMTKACEPLPNRQANGLESTDLLIIPAGDKYQKLSKLWSRGGIVATYQPSDDILLSATGRSGV